MKWLISDWNIVYMQSMKDWHVTKIGNERINRKSGGQGVAKL